MGLLVLSGLGLSSLGMHEKGLRAERQQEFISVAEKVRFDVRKKLDAFLQTEQARAYTDYQYYYVPIASNEATALVRSPLANTISNGLAYGYFQLDESSTIANPYAPNPQRANAEVRGYLDNLTLNLLPSLGNGETQQIVRIEPSEPKIQYDSRISTWERASRRRTVETPLPETTEKEVEIPEGALAQVRTEQAETQAKIPSKKDVSAKSKKQVSSRRRRMPIDFEESQAPTQIMNVSRDNVDQNLYNNTAVQQQEMGAAPRQAKKESAVDADAQAKLGQSLQKADEAPAMEMMDMMIGQPSPKPQQRQPDQQATDDLVQVRIEPFVPITVPAENGDNGVFAGQVFLLRHVQIEDQHLLQGFRLDETELLQQIGESAKDHILRGMSYDLSRNELPSAAYTAVLDFGFGEVVLNLIEQQPDWIVARVAQIRNWFFAILAIVWIAVIVALTTFWRNMVEQVQLSRKKDDFISAVSHELRTPLTSIRMYTEMLEKDWVKTDDKRREYYSTMRQESERLSRLIENVLDFSRIQRGKKHFEFTMGDVNECIGEVVEMMRPYAERAGFHLLTSFEELDSFAFDRDAVVQIVINLLDNALKYAKDAGDKHILIRTGRQRDYVVIEVEDRGPGIPRSQQKKIFEAFYRCADESTRQATGTGLGLALVKRFAEAHHGFVEILNAKPTGALFRVGLANHYGK